MARIRTIYKKRAIPNSVRRDVALAAGATPGEDTPTECRYCGMAGLIAWPRLYCGKPGAWVTFPGLELDHIVPESVGGRATSENIVLACRPCNRKKGAQRAHPKYQA